MSSVFGVSAADIERRLPEFIPQGRALACYVSSIAILMIIFMNSHFFLPDFPGWLFLGVLLTAAVMIRYASFQQQSHRPHPQAPHDELSGQQVDVPTFVTREQLPDIRIQLAHLNREFDDSDYDALRALDEDINANVFGMSEEEINAIPIYKYRVQSHPHSQKAKDCTKVEGSKFEEIELTCSICMEQVNEEELIRRLPCSHEFHASCIFPWLRQHGTCPICKRRAV